MGSTEISNYEPAEAIELPAPPALPVETGWKSLDGLTKAAIITCTLMVVTFIAPPVGFVFALATIGLSAGALSVARRDGRRNRTAFTTLMVGSVALAILVVGSLVLIRGGSEAVTVGEPIPVPEGAPRADVFVTLESIGRSGKSETTKVKDRIDLRQVDGTAVHLVDATSELGTTGIYRWESLNWMTEDGDYEELSCMGDISPFGTASSSCGWDKAPVPGVEPPNISFGEYQSDGLTVFDVMIWNSPPEGVWMSVETEIGINVVSDIVDGVGFANYEGKHGQASFVTVHDASHAVIWRHAIG